MGQDDEDVNMKDMGESDDGDPTEEIKQDTVVLPEGVCLLDKSFVVIERDPDGKKFDKVSRYVCRCSSSPLELLLDVNIDVYPLKIGVSIQAMVTTTLHYDGSPMPTNYSNAIFDKSTLMDEFEYVCHGRVFRIKDVQDAKVQVFASLGGLIMRLVGEPLTLDKFQMDQEVFLLVKVLKPPAAKKASIKRAHESL